MLTFRSIIEEFLSINNYNNHFRRCERHTSRTILFQTKFPLNSRKISKWEKE